MAEEFHCELNLKPPKLILKMINDDVSDTDIKETIFDGEKQRTTTVAELYIAMG